MLSKSPLHLYWDFLVAFFVDPIVTVVMVFVLIVNIAAGVLGVIARLAVYAFVVVSFFYSCSLNLWCEALFLIKKFKFPQKISSPSFFDTVLIF